MSKARRYSMPYECTLFYDDLPHGFQEYFLRKVEKKRFDIGLGILWFTNPNGNWVMVCTKGLIWCNENSFDFASYDIINRVTYVQEEMERVSLIEPIKIARRSHLQQIKLILENGETYFLWVNNGAEWDMFNNMIVRINKLYGGEDPASFDKGLY